MIKRPNFVTADPADLTTRSAPLQAKESPWIEEICPSRSGNCSVLLVAPHGHNKDDTNTGKLTRELADQLDCYAVINEEFLKTSTAGVQNADPDKFIADFYKESDAASPALKSLFYEKVVEFKKHIINNYDMLYVLYIHGIADENSLKVAKLIPEYKDNASELKAIIGYGQWSGAPKYTADFKKTIGPLIENFRNCGLEVAIAPTKPIIVEGRKKWYCGRNRDRLNQALYDSKLPMQSMQIELKEAGIRDTNANCSDKAMAMANAIRTFLVSAVQKGSIRYIKAEEIDLDAGNVQFKFRQDDFSSDEAEFGRLVDSIKINGILNNIIVRKRSTSNGKLYQLISGFRRMAALQVALGKKNSYASTTVPARILDETVPDDKAYQISFTENLARKNLSLWEIAQGCARLKRELEPQRLSKSVIENRLSNLIQKDTRTVRRYLKLASIKNKDIQEAVHIGNISPTAALEIGKKDFTEDDIAALLNHLQTYPKTTRAFERFSNNLFHCCNLSELSVHDVLGCKYSDNFLSLEKEELNSRIENLKKQSGKEYPDILQGEAGSLTKKVDQIKSALKKQQAVEDFQKSKNDIAEKVEAAFKNSKINGKFKISPVSNSKGNQIKVTITSPEDQIWNAIGAVLKANEQLDEET